MKTDIRKISVGTNYPDNSMHYQVGKTFKLQTVEYTVERIAVNRELKMQGKTAYDIFLSNSEGTVLWKTIVDMPVIVENNIDFE